MIIKTNFWRRVSESKNKTLFAVFIITIFASLCLLSSQKKIKINQNLLLETFSAVIQIFVALTALLGMVGVFKLERLNITIDRLVESAEDLIVHFCGLPGLNLLPEEVFREAKRILSEEHSASASQIRRLEMVVAKLENLYSTVNDVRLHTLDFVIFSFVNISMSLLFLVSTSAISNLYIGLPALLVVVVLAVVSLLSAIGLMQSIL